MKIEDDEFPPGEKPWFVRSGRNNFNQRVKNASLRFDRRLLELRESGLTAYNIGLMYNISESAVSSRARKALRRLANYEPLPPRNCTLEPTKDETIADLRAEVKRLRKIIYRAAESAKEGAYELQRATH